MVLLKLFKGFLVVLACLAVYAVAPSRFKPRLVARIEAEAKRADSLNPNRHNHQ